MCSKWFERIFQGRGQSSVFERIGEARALFHFAGERLPHYAPLVSGDLRRFRDEIVSGTVGACVAMVAGFMFAGFLSVAAIVSAWNTPHRIAAAWVVCGIWGLMSLVGLALARRAVSVPPPFHLVSTALIRDYMHFADSMASKAHAPEH
jgi:hypothetical protein